MEELFIGLSRLPMARGFFWKLVKKPSQRSRRHSSRLILCGVLRVRSDLYPRFETARYKPQGNKPSSEAFAFGEVSSLILTGGVE